MQQDPAEQLRTSLAKLGYGSLESACPACFANQLALWCAQTVPKCGSFAAAVEGSLLPAITTITTGEPAVFLPSYAGACMLSPKSGLCPSGSSKP